MSGRGERIRTFDTLVPNQVLYQTELRPENEHYYKLFFIKSNWILQNLQKRDYCLTNPLLLVNDSREGGQQNKQKTRGLI